MSALTGNPIREEAVTFARYLCGRTPPDEIVERYGSAVGALFTTPAPIDRRIVAWAVQHPWALGSMDAACALLFPRNELRNRLLLMVGLLETTPPYCDEFFPSPFRASSFLLRSAFIAVRTAAAVVTGVLIIAWLRAASR